MRYIALIVLALTLAAGCGVASTTTTAAPAATAARAVSSPSCQSQADAWRPAGLRHQQALASAMSNVGSDDTSLVGDIQSGMSSAAGETRLAGDLGTLEGAILNIKMDLPPACIPGLDADLKSALNGYGDYSTYQIEALGALNRGDTQGADLDFTLATASLAPADASMQAAINDLDTFNGTVG